MLANVLAASNDIRKDSEPETGRREEIARIRVGDTAPLGKDHVQRHFGLAVPGDFTLSELFFDFVRTGFGVLGLVSRFPVEQNFDCDGACLVASNDQEA